MIAVVSGATGLSGRALLRELCIDARISEVRALVRKPGSLAALKAEHGKLREIQLPAAGFAGIETSTDPLLSGELYFCALGTTIRKAGSREAFKTVDLDAVASSGRLCEARKGRCLVLVSAVASDPKSLLFYSRIKGQAEEAVSALAIPRVVIARPSLLIGDRHEWRPAERASIVAFRAVSSLLPAGLRARLGTDVAAMAGCLVREALDPSPGRLILEARDLT